MCGEIEGIGREGEEEEEEGKEREGEGELHFPSKSLQLWRENGSLPLLPFPFPNLISKRLFTSISLSSLSFSLHFCLSKHKSDQKKMCTWVPKKGTSDLYFVRIKLTCLGIKWENEREGPIFPPKLERIGGEMELNSPPLPPLFLPFFPFYLTN